MAKVGKILIQIVTVAAIIAVNIAAAALGGPIGAILAIIGTIAVTMAGNWLSNALFGQKPPMSEAKYNVRIEQSYRSFNGGRVLQGGTVGFAEFDGSGNLWYVIIHCDSILATAPIYFLDNIQVTLNGANEVTTPDFVREGTRYFQLWTHTHSETNPIPPGSSALASAFPSKWSTLQHLLAGTTYTVVRCRSIKIENRAEVYRWRGPLGMGEPNVSVLGDWSNMYDPRDETQTLGDRSTYKPSRNCALVWAWWRTHPFGMNKPESSINWDMIAEQADICDEVVVGIDGSQPRYECGIAARDDIARGDIQQQIAMACDGQIVFDDEGKSWLRVGKYEAPTLYLSRNRDIIAMQSVETTDTEMETQGVVVRYIEPSASNTLQSSAPWRNPNFYVEGQGNNFLIVDIPTIFNHNQAMRIAKAIGMRSQPLQKIVPTTGLRGLRALQERFVNINYDNTFSGDYEIATPVEIDRTGMFCTLGMVPVDPDRFDLLPGEERTKPNGIDTSEAIVIPLATGVIASIVNNRVEVTFDPPARDDVTYEFQYIATANISTGLWLNMYVRMDDYFAYTDTLPSDVEYTVRWRSVTFSGRSAWTTASTTVTTPEQTVPGDGDIIDGQVPL